MLLALPACAAALAPAATGSLLSAGQAMVLGLVEGITEYLPVSSTAHLLLTQHMLGVVAEGDAKDAMNAYEIVIQAGAILAVLFLYFGRVRSVCAGLMGKDPAGRRLGINILIAFAPAVVLGFLFEKQIKHYLFGLWPVVAAWIVGGFIILWVVRRRDTAHEEGIGKVLESLTPMQALSIGLLQCVAMWPGVSRSLATILGGLLVGLSAGAAVEFSFLLGMLTLTGATVHDGYKYGHGIIHYFGVVNPLIGFAVAGVSAFLAVKWLVGYLNRHGLGIFGYYRIALGIVVAGLLAMGWLVQ
jgi:undecaprenyl-diphosphatase